VDVKDRTRARWLPAAIGVLALITCAAFNGGGAVEGEGSNPPKTSTATTPMIACRSRSDCGAPLKAGLRITFTGWACTSAFLARRETGNDLYLITAGHCLASTGLAAGWSHAGVTIGHGIAMAFADERRTDAGVLAASEPGARNLLFGSTPADIRAATGSTEKQVVGAQVCRSGGSAGWTCGTVTRADVDTRIRGALVRHTWWMGFPSREGDSGSPVIDHDGALVGMVVATTPSETVYVPVDDISSSLGVRPCLDPACK
jgi:hypothetical protein